MFEFVCERIIPGCAHKETDESREKVIERAEAHMLESHDLDVHDRLITDALRTTGVMFVRPV